jgi:hypothetical protein
VDRCYFKCGAVLATKYSRETVAGWTWFTGSGKHTVHVCRNCQHDHREEVLKMAAARGIELDDLPREAPYPRLADPLPKIEQSAEDTGR